MLKTVRPVSLLLLDVQMPRKSGIQVLIEIKDYFRNVNNMTDDGVEVLAPKIVLLTSYLTPTLRQHLKSLGCKYFYDKPLSLQQLRDILLEGENC